MSRIRCETCVNFIHTIDPKTIIRGEEMGICAYTDMDMGADETACASNYVQLRRPTKGRKRNGLRTAT